MNKCAKNKRSVAVVIIMMLLCLTAVFMLTTVISATTPAYAWTEGEIETQEETVWDVLQQPDWWWFWLLVAVSVLLIVAIIVVLVVMSKKIKEVEMRERAAQDALRASEHNRSSAAFTKRR